LCPALDPAAGTCDLYAARPITCRTFGPAVRFGAESLAVCELCYQGAADAEIAACEVAVDPENLEAELLHELEAAGQNGETVVAFALAVAS
jgi:Fe-S-cluster containining protein